MHDTFIFHCSNRYNTIVIITLINKIKFLSKLFYYFFIRYWYKVYSVLDSPLWTKMRNFRYVMIFTCILLDIINIYWFKKMFRGAVLVVQSNWEYYEKHHKNQQLEMLASYKNQFKNSILLANEIVYRTTKSGLSKINPSKFIGSRVS